MNLRRIRASIAESLGRASARRPGPARPTPAGLGSADARPAPGPGVTVDVLPEAEPFPELEYAPRHDGDADPGEVVWAWVPYEDDPRYGKDRPVLIVGRAGDRLIGLMLSSKDHDQDAADEARFGRFWMDIGTGGWDHRRRPSEVRLDRVLSLAPDGVRREGAALSRSVFARVVAALRALHDR